MTSQNDTSTYTVPVFTRRLVFIAAAVSILSSLPVIFDGISKGGFWVIGAIFVLIFKATLIWLVLHICALLYPSIKKAFICIALIAGVLIVAAMIFSIIPPLFWTIFFAVGLAILVFRK